MNRFLATLIVAFSSSLLWAQQIPLFTQYRDMQGVINPAAIPQGFFTDRHAGSIGLSIRRQWLDMPGPPTTQLLRGEYFFKNYSGVTILTGGHLISDQTGPTGFTGLYGRIAGVITADPEYSGLSFGMAAGGVQYRLRTAELKLRDPDDIRANEDRTKFYPDISLGAFFYQRLDNLAEDDYIYAGVSVPQLFALDLSLPTVASGSDVFIRRVPHYYATAGWYHFITETSFVEPSVWVRYVQGAPVSVDINCRYQAGGHFWIGAGGSIQGMIHAETGLILGKNMGFNQNLRFGYGFDYSTRTYGPFVGTTHEINLSFSF